MSDSKPAFDDSQPFTSSAKPAFDDSQPFEAANAPAPSMGDYAMKGLQGAGKALDYQRGAVGAPILSKIATAISGKPTMSDQEYQDALNPTTTRRAPSSDTIMARAGVPSGPTASSVAPWAYQDPEYQRTLSNWNPAKYAPAKGGLLDATPRGVAGGILDMATDPLTYEMGGANKVAEAAQAVGESTPLVTKVLTPASNAVEAIGNHNYNKGMAPLIAKGDQYGKDVGDTLYNQGLWGRSSSIAKGGDLAAESLKDQRDKLMQAAQTAGAAPSVSTAFEPLVDHVQELVSDGRMTPNEAETVVQKYAEKMGQVQNPTLQQMSQWKSDISNSLPATAYDVTKNSKMSANMGKIAAGGNRAEVERAANAALPGSGDAINDTNRELGNLLTVQGVADKQAARAANSKLISPQDIGHAFIAGSASGNPALGAGTLLSRIAAATMNQPVVRTSLGYGMKKAGTGAVSAPLLDAAAVNTLRNMANKNQPTAGVGR